MKVLIACEESQEVCKAFRRRGHEAYSCDIQEPSGGHPEWHILGDAVTAHCAPALYIPEQRRGKTPLERSCASSRSCHERN